MLCGLRVVGDGCCVVGGDRDRCCVVSGGSIWWVLGGRWCVCLCIVCAVLDVMFTAVVTSGARRV